MSSQTSTEVPVLISGAGPVGLVLALALAKNGIAVRIIEKSSTFHNTERGAGLQPRSLEAFNLLGVLPDILKVARPPPWMKLYKVSETEPIKTWDLNPPQDPVPSIPWPTILLHGQQFTEAAVRSHLKLHGVHVELGTELRSFTQDADGVSAHIVKTSDSGETEETVRAHYLIGADGARGIVRKQLGLAFLGETREDTELAVLVDLRLTGLDRKYWHVWGDNSTERLLLRPTERDDDSCWIMASGNIDHAKLVADREEFVKYVHRVSSRPDLKIEEIKSIIQWRPNIRMVDKFGEGRVFVVGDAAHVHSPAGGQGLNSGIQDSLNLAWKLALVEKGLSPSSVLSTYNSERLPVIAEMLQLTTALFEKAMAAQADSPDLSALKRDPSLTQLGVNYRWSKIVVDERSRTKDGAINAYGTAEDELLHAGDRAPEAPALKDVDAKDDTTTSFFRIFSPAQHTAIIFTGKPDEVGPVLDAIDKYPEGTISSVIVLPQAMTSAPVIDRVKTVLQDTEGYAYSGYGVVDTGLTVVIVRPDGVVGAIVRDAPGIERYRNLLFSQD